MPSPIEIFFSYSHKDKRLRASKMLAFSGLPYYTTTQRLKRPAPE